MDTVIQIKRSANITAPTISVLAEGELAYSQDRSNDGAGAVLYIESVDSSLNQVIHKIGGKYYTDIIDKANVQAAANSLVLRDAGGNVYATNFFGQAQSANVASYANALTTGRYINLTGDASGSAFFDGTGNADISVTLQPNSIELGTDTTGIYVANVTAGTGIQVSGGGIEVANVTVALTNTGVTANTYGGASAIPVFTVDAQGRITSAANVATAASSFTLNGDTGTDTFNTGENLYFVGGLGISTAVTDNTITFVNDGVVNIKGTANQITANAATGSVKLSIPNTFIMPGTAEVTSDLVVGGNLTVNGTTTVVNTQIVTTEDSLLKLANNNILADTVDIGFYGEYNSGNVSYAGLIRDASDGIFYLFKDVSSDPIGNVLTYSALNRATVNANLTGGNVSGLASAISVADGGTGVTSFTGNAVLYGNGTGAIKSASGTTGQVLQINASGVPVFSMIDGGNY